MAIKFAKTHHARKKTLLEMKCTALLFCLLSLGLVQLSRQEDLASLEALSTQEQEQLLNKKLESHLAGVEKQLEVLDRLLNTYYKDYNYTEEDAHEYVSNPINTYMLIKRTGLEWPAAKKVIFNDAMDQEFKEIETLVELVNKKNTGVESSETADDSKTEL